MFGATVAQAAPAAPQGTPPARSAAAGTSPATGERATVPDSEARATIARTLTAAAAAGQLTPAQKRTLGQILSERTGISQADAEQRVDQAFKDAQSAVETARKTAVLGGLGTATALLVGLLAAWYAAQRGGHHRDNNIPARVVFSASPLARRTPTPRP
jgi:hypothetical protein